MADEKKDKKAVAPIEPGATIDYVIAVLFEVDISRIGYHGALKRRHEMLGDMQEDYDKEFGEDIDD
jgi:hypothetical protein